MFREHLRKITFTQNHRKDVKANRKGGFANTQTQANYQHSVGSILNAAFLPN